MVNLSDMLQSIIETRSLEVFKEKIHFSKNRGLKAESNWYESEVED